MFAFASMLWNRPGIHKPIKSMQNQEQVIAEHTDILMKEHGYIGIAIFWSRARWSHFEDSDVDLLIFKKSGSPERQVTDYKWMIFEAIIVTFKDCHDYWSWDLDGAASILGDAHVLSDTDDEVHAFLKEEKRFITKRIQDRANWDFTQQLFDKEDITRCVSASKLTDPQWAICVMDEKIYGIIEMYYLYSWMAVPPRKQLMKSIAHFNANLHACLIGYQGTVNLEEKIWNYEKTLGILKKILHQTE